MFFYILPLFLLCGGGAVVLVVANSNPLFDYMSSTTTTSHTHKHTARKRFLFGLCSDSNTRSSRLSLKLREIDFTEKMNKYLNQIVKLILREFPIEQGFFRPHHTYVEPNTREFLKCICITLNRCDIVRPRR